MGGTFSRELSKRLNNGRTTLNALFEDPNFQEMVVNQLPELSNDARTFLTKLIRPERDRLKPVFSLTDIQIAPDIVNDIPQWMLNAESFWESSDQAYFQGNVKIPGEVEYVYWRLVKIEEERETSKLSLGPVHEARRRLHLCAFYLLSKKFETTMSNYTIRRKVSRDMIADRVASSAFVDVAPSQIREAAARWSLVGATYEAIGRALGDYGVLLILPSSVPRTMWENMLYKSSPRFDEVMEHLRSINICGMSQAFNADQAAANVLAFARAIDPPPLGIEAYLDQS